MLCPGPSGRSKQSPAKSLSTLGQMCSLMSYTTVSTKLGTQIMSNAAVHRAAGLCMSAEVRPRTWGSTQAVSTL